MRYLLILLLIPSLCGGHRMTPDSFHAMHPAYGIRCGHHCGYAG